MPVFGKKSAAKETKQYRNFSGEIKNLQKSNEFVFDVEIYLLNDEVNRNNWKYINLESHKDKFAGTPILIAYINNGNGVGDGHNFRMVRDPQTGEAVPTFTDATAERIVGALSDNPDDIRIEERDGKTWIVGKGYLWRWYARELVEKIERDALQGRSMSISIETLVTDSYMDNGVEVERKYEILGTTILGDHVNPAVKDARIVALQEMESEFKKLKVRAASYRKPNVQEHMAKDKTTKGVRSMNLFSKKQIAELSNRFNGYTVLSAAQDENGIYVCLLSAKGEPAIYTMASADETVIPERIATLSVSAEFRFDENTTVSVNLMDAVEPMAARANSAETEMGKAKGELETALNALKAMQIAEEARRVNAAKTMAKNTLDAFNANREDKIADTVLENLNAEIAKGVYTNSVDKDGNWIGEKQVRGAVMAICAEKVMEQDKEKAAKNNSVFAWDNLPKEQKMDDGSVEGLLASWNIK